MTPSMLQHKPKRQPKKPKWTPRPATPPEPYEFPPEEKKLADILKEEKIPPTKRYARKPKELDVHIPFVIPWEQWPAIMTQEGMGAFGKPRDPFIKIDEGRNKLVQGEVPSETVIPLASTPVSAGRSGMLPFGAYRRNVADIIDSHEYDDSKLRLSEGIVPMQNKGLIYSQSGEIPMGALRQQTPNIKYTKNMTEGCDPESHKFLSRQFAPCSSEQAGSTIIDRRRNVIANVQGHGEDLGKYDHETNSLIPLLFNPVNDPRAVGSAFGSFRPLIHEAEGGFTMTYDEAIKCNMIIPFQTAPSLRT
ncbi:hypothetical protein AB6A40_003042 [Gnathostoma spinigerum]|uniref:Uncharacterized protein n=1 Tax=Gnathostoma spinigerum TaxID=75299 RepID=A0ABD6EH97_9BILA